MTLETTPETITLSDEAWQALEGACDLDVRTMAPTSLTRLVED